MFGIDDAIIAGAVSGGLNMAGDLWSQSNARDAFQHRYQDTVADMKAAGLNPALAYGQGGGSPQTMPAGDWGSSAATAAQAMANAQKTRAETGLLQAQSNDLIQRARIMNEYINSGIENRRAGTDYTTAKTTMTNYDIAQRKRTFESDVNAQIAANLQQQLQTPEARARAKYYDQTGPASFYLNNATDIAKSVAALRGAQGLNKPRTPIYMRQYR